jgi:hypothetical protein
VSQQVEITSPKLGDLPQQPEFEHVDSETKRYLVSRVGIWNGWLRLENLQETVFPHLLKCVLEMFPLSNPMTFKKFKVGMIAVWGSIPMV